MRRYHLLSYLIILSRVTSFNYSLNYANRRESRRMCDSFPHRPRNWIALSCVSGRHIAPSWRITFVSRAIAESPIFWFRATRHLLEAIYFPRFPDKQLPSLPIQRYDCAPGNSYHVRIVNHEMRVGIKFL